MLDNISCRGRKYLREWVSLIIEPARLLSLFSGFCMHIDPIIKILINYGNNKLL